MPEFSKFRFRPTLFSSIGLLVLLPCLVLLGIWQLYRADEKRLIETQNDQRGGLPQLVLNGADEGRDDLLYRMVIARGSYLTGKTFLLDNQVDQGKAGYHVISPLLLDSQSILLVNRGWITMGADRRRLPVLSTPDHMLKVQGRIRGLPDVGIRLDDYSTGPVQWPKVVQYLEPEQASRWLSKPVLPFLLQLGPDENHGYTRNWKEPVILKTENHVAYAIQWFSMALILSLIYLKMSIQRRPE